MLAQLFEGSQRKNKILIVCHFLKRMYNKYYLLLPCIINAIAINIYPSFMVSAKGAGAQWGEGKRKLKNPLHHINQSQRGDTPSFCQP